MPIWPLQSQCDAYYGNPRGSNGQASTLWKLRNLTTVTPPFRMTYAGQPIKSITVHKKCADSLKRVLNAIWLAAGYNQHTIDWWGVSLFGGSFNFRVMRGSSHLSMHSYGCAIDLAPQRFPMGAHDKTFAPQVIKAFADEGWVNLPNDRMHFQAARLSGAPAPLTTSTPKPIIGEHTMATTVTSASVKNTLNTVSLSTAFTIVGAAIPWLLSTFGTYGLVAAGVAFLCILVQAFLPVGTAKAVEGAAASLVPVAEQIDPALKPILDQVLEGIRAAQANSPAPSA